MEKKNKIDIRTLRFPITSEIANVEEYVKAAVNEIYRDSRVREVEIKTSHTNNFLVYDIISELY